MILRTTVSAAETAAMGEELAARLRPGDIVALVGELGGGKTAFVGGICHGLGIQGHVSSPTFTLIHHYPAGDVVVVHADMYRISTLREAADLGLEDYFVPPHICLIEWADRILELLPPEHYLVTFTHGSRPDERTVVLYAPGEVRA